MSTKPAKLVPILYALRVERQVAIRARFQPVSLSQLASTLAANTNLHSLGRLYSSLQPVVFLTAEVWPLRWLWALVRCGLARVL